MSRLRSSPTLDTCANERRLLKTYFVHPQQRLAQLSDDWSSVDEASVGILKMFDANVLTEYSPRATYGDGNCLYRAVSLALYSADLHDVMRLLTALEIVEHPEEYNRQSPAYCGNIYVYIYKYNPRDIKCFYIFFG